jgi:uncharacterized protein (AIM24 family)
MPLRRVRGEHDVIENPETGRNHEEDAPMRSELFAPQHQEQQGEDTFTLQNSKMLKVALNGEVMALQGSMVAYQGQMNFDYQGSGGVGKFIKKALTGEGQNLMKVSGQGDLFLAQDAADVHLIRLENDAITVNGKNILAFEPTIQWDIHRVEGAGALAGGLFNTLLQGTGWVAVTTRGTPVLLQTNAPTFADAQAAIAWSAGLQTRVHASFKLSNLVGRSSGESIQMAFHGQGFIIVQPSEGPPTQTQQQPQGGGSGFNLNFG